ncbi:MAG TPA: hypothetical protein VFD32_16575 [Dehalococcoidia bacterium]|nr:hypothetical protein [Dehalococcoidia bacterium]
MPQGRLLRVPRRPVFVLAIIAALVVVGGGRIKPAAAATPPSYHIAVTFTNVYFTYLDDGCDVLLNCDKDAQLYGEFGAAAHGPSGFTSRGSRVLGHWGSQSGWCPGDGVSWWDASYSNATCFREVGWGLNYNVAQTFLCASADYRSCAGPYAKNNNTIVLTVQAGETIGLGSDLIDYDKSSGDDSVCYTNKSFGPYTADQLATLNTSGTLYQGFNGFGGCKVSFTLQRVN